MAIVPDHSASNAVEEDFGANDWLLEEMYEQYRSDPGSVDPSWAAYFETHGAPGEDNGKPVHMRIVNTFTTPDTIDFKQEYSEDGQKWIAMATGVEHRVSPKAK